MSRVVLHQSLTEDATRTDQAVEVKAKARRKRPVGRRKAVPEMRSQRAYLSGTNRYALFDLGILHLGIKLNELRVLLVLCAHADEGGRCFPSVETIAREAAFNDTRSVREALSGLVRLDIIERGARTGRTNLYQLIAPPENEAVQRIFRPLNKTITPPTDQIDHSTDERLPQDRIDQCGDGTFNQSEATTLSEEITPKKEDDQFSALVDPVSERFGHNSVVDLKGSASAALTCGFHIGRAGARCERCKASWSEHYPSVYDSSAATGS